VGRARGFNEAFRSLNLAGPEANGHRSSPPANPTDLGNALRLVARHGEDLRHVHEWGRWMVWAGKRWETDRTGEVERRAKETVRSIYAEASNAEHADARKSLADHAKRSESKGRIEAMIALAASEPGIPVTPEELDADAWLLNADNGTVDLRTGELRPHNREDLLTKLAPVEYDPDAKATSWEVFLERVLPGEELRGFVQRGVGYSATGDTSEQCMFINHGAGANGKSTFQETLAAALGDYAMRTPTEMLLTKRSGGIPNDVARLKGARFVAASETEEGRRLAESLVKDLTGQDTISARFMRAEWFDFKPTHKLWLSTNHKPEIRGTDNAIWRRIRLIPWAVTIPPAERNHKLPAKLRDELPGILAWAVRGCLEWKREGLGESEEVRTATAEYRAEQDVLAGFLDECCVARPEAWVKFADLYEVYTSWCEKSNETVQNRRRFGTQLKERGFEPDRGTGNVPIRTGLALLSDRKPPNQGNSDSESYPTVTQQNTSKSHLSEDAVTERYPENAINSLDFGPREVTGKQGNYGNYGNSAASGTDDLAPPEVAAFLADPPALLLEQAKKCAVEGGEASPLFRPLVSSVAYGVFGTVAGRWDQTRPVVLVWLRELQGKEGR
jgi:putative DNA primase/helicase